MGRPARHPGGDGRRALKDRETVVTFLEARALPARMPAQPLQEGLALMRAPDIPLNYYRFLYAEVGRNWHWVERAVLDDAALSQQVHAPGVEISVLYVHGAPAGYFELDFSNRESTELVYFGLMPHALGRGIGPWLLGLAMRQGFARGANRLTVNTCTLDHPAALRLYQRMGFVPYAQETRRIAGRTALPQS